MFENISSFSLKKSPRRAVLTRPGEAATTEFGNDLKDGWFNIKNEADVEYAMRIMKIKAKFGKNIVPRKNK